jgi:hypothetical protein
LKYSINPSISLPQSLFPGFEGDDGGAGNTDNNSGGQAPLTMETVNTIVNAAVANLRKKDLPALLNQHLTPITTQLTEFGTILQGLRPTTDGGSGSASGSGTSTGTGSASGGGLGSTSSSVPPEVNAMLKTLNETVKRQETAIKDLATAKEAAEKQARETAKASHVRESLAGFNFATPSAANTAFELVRGQVKEQEDGGYIAGDNLPVADFIKDFLQREHPYLLKATESRGSGATGSMGSGGGKPFDINQIRPGMTKEERALAVSKIADSYQTAQSR